jgi:hypothetical protein
MGTTYTGHEGIARFHRFMLNSHPTRSSSSASAADRAVAATSLESGAAHSPAHSGCRDKLVDAAGSRFTVARLAACEYRADGTLASHRAGSLRPAHRPSSYDRPECIAHGANRPDRSSASPTCSPPLTLLTLGPAPGGPGPFMRCAETSIRVKDAGGMGRLT